MISVNAAFDSGNIRLVGTDGDRIDLEIVKDNDSDFFQWFYFRVAGGEAARSPSAYSERRDIRLPIRLARLPGTRQHRS